MFSIKKAFGFGYAMFKEKAGLMVGVLFLSMLVGSFGDIAHYADAPHASVTFLNVVSFVFSMITTLGAIYIALKLYDGKNAVIMDVFAPYRRTGAFVGASLIYVMMILVGLIFFVIPGVYLGLKYQFFAHAMIYKNMGIIDSLKESARITEGELWHLCKLAGALILLNVLGFITLVGWIITFPMTGLIGAYVYRRLSSPKQEDVLANDANAILASFEKNAIAASEA